MTAEFLFDGVVYDVSVDACRQGGNIRLPDGRYLQVDGWFETWPPQPDIVGVAPDDVVRSRPTFHATARS